MIAIIISKDEPSNVKFYCNATILKIGHINLGILLFYLISQWKHEIKLTAI
jgi:hypothetical protein